MIDDQQRARELLAQAYERHGHDAKANACRAGRNDLIRSEHAIEAITAALRAAPEVVGEVWRLVDSDGGQFGGLYSSEWDASVDQLRWQGDRTVSPFTVQRLELIAARPQEASDA